MPWAWLVCSALLIVAQDPPAADDPATAAALADYNARKAKLPNTADAHWRLAVWCEERGLKAEAGVHFTAVTRLDPRRDAAWKRLGYKKRNGRWMTDEQIEAEAEQVKANKVWGPRLEKLHDRLHDPKK